MEFQTLLIFTTWRTKMQEEKANVIIANALNKCVYFVSARIKGYLLTKRRLFLVFENTNEESRIILEAFNEFLLAEIFDYLRSLPRHQRELIFDLEDDEELFHEHRFINPTIKKIIIGEEIELPYYDPHVEKIEKEIKNYNYCSAIDYSGARGPVVVRKR